MNFLKGYQKSASDLLRASAEVHGRRALQPRAVDRRRRLGSVPRARPENATQTRLNFLPEHGTDFVFASYSEQRGFVGASLLLALYLLVLWRGLRVVTVARDLYSAIVAGGIVLACSSRSS